MANETAGSALPVLEREEELRALGGLIADCLDGHGRVAVVEGPAGIGKTSLLAEARARACSDGLTVLAARGGELEGDFGFGVVRQLLEPELARADAVGREVLLAGAARLAEPVFATEPSAAGGEPTHAVLHGLYWLVANLSEQSPLLLAVDDVHWADAASLRFLLHLARRLDGLPVALCLSARTGEQATQADLLRALVLEAPPPVIRPRGLSSAAVERLVRAAIGPRASSEVCSALYLASGGNPFLVVEALEQLRDDHDGTGEIDPAVIGRLASQRIAAALLLRVGRINRDAPALAHAVAVLGDQATRERAGRLAGLDRELVPRLVASLVDAAVLAPGEPLGFVHPIVRTAIYQDIGATRRADLHLRAARQLADDGAQRETIAVHLLAADPHADPFAVQVLRAAAATATARGSPETAVRYLHHALGEPPDSSDLPEVFFELGQAELMAGDFGGIERLREAVARLPSGRRRAEVGRVLARALVAAARQAESVEAYDRAIADVSESEDDLALELDAEAANAARMIRLPRPWVTDHVTRNGSRVEAASRAQRMAFAELAHDCALDNGPASTVASLARRALDGGQLAAETADAGPVWDAILALLVADDLEVAEHHLAGLLADGHRHGSLVPVAGASVMRAFSAMQRGDVAKTASEAQAALDAARGGFGLVLAMGSAYLAHALIERGDLEAATRVLDEALPPASVPDDVVFDHLLFERVRLRLALGQPSGALSDLRLLGDHVAHWHREDTRTTGAGGPVVPHLPGLQHRALLVRTLWHLDDREGARQAAEEELTFARAWGTPRAFGVALMARGLLESGERGIATLAEAVEQLARSPARLEHAHGLVELGSALRRAGHRAQAREKLGEGMDVAHRCGALALARAAREELGLLGARPRRLALTGADSLTPSEYRVCEMAAEGATNKEIAQALFVTLRTIEGHLSNAYAKLAIRSREELKQALHAQA